MLPVHPPILASRLRLVLDDANHLNAVDHGNLHKLLQDDRVLAQFLGAPVRDAA